MGSDVKGAAAAPASILGMGTYVPPYVMEQSTFADWLFDLSGSSHMTELKAKFGRICDRTMIGRRYISVPEEFLRSNPTITAYQQPSITLRQQVMDVEMPRMAEQAARIALKEWGRPLSDITHLIFVTTNSGCVPGSDFELLKLLGLNLNVKRYMLYHTGCHGGGTLIRIAKDLAENNPGSRILAVACETIVSSIRGPCETHMGNLVGQALFGDGAAALVIGASPHAGVEKPIYEIVWTSQDIIENSEDAITAKVRDEGIVYNLLSTTPKLIGENIETLVNTAMKAVGITDRNNMFWMMHPGGRAILDNVQSALGITEDKLKISREVMWDYGNQLSACVLFVMEAMRRRSVEQKLATAGEGCEWGLLFGFGPGLTVETAILRCP